MTVVKNYIIIITVANMGNARTLNATVFFKGHQCSKHSVAELGTTVLGDGTAALSFSLCCFYMDT